MFLSQCALKAETLRCAWRTSMFRLSTHIGISRLQGVETIPLPLHDQDLEATHAIRVGQRHDFLLHHTPPE